MLTEHKTESEYLEDEKKTISLAGESLVDIIKECLARDSSFRFKVKGSSMSPFINDDDIVTLSPLSKFPITLGAPAAFTRPGCGKLVIHRVIAKIGENYLIKGDNALGTDGVIPQDNILGVVTRVERRGKEFHLGQGPERIIVAHLSKMRLFPMIFWCWQRIPFFIREFIKHKL